MRLRSEIGTVLKLRDLFVESSIPEASPIKTVETNNKMRSTAKITTGRMSADELGKLSRNQACLARWPCAVYALALASTIR